MSEYFIFLFRQLYTFRTNAFKSIVINSEPNKCIPTYLGTITDLSSRYINQKVVDVWDKILFIYLKRKTPLTTRLTGIINITLDA